MSNKSSKQKSETDWARVAAMTDADIDLSDVPEISAERIRAGKLRLPGGRVMLRSVIPGDLDSWLDSTGEPRDEVVARALREYRERHPRSA